MSLIAVFPSVLFHFCFQEEIRALDFFVMKILERMVFLATTLCVTAVISNDLRSHGVWLLKVRYECIPINEWQGKGKQNGKIEGSNLWEQLDPLTCLQFFFLPQPNPSSNHSQGKIQLAARMLNPPSKGKWMDLQSIITVSWLFKLITTSPGIWTILLNACISVNWDTC